MSTKISASIIADSKNEFGQRITTYVLTFPRIILAELNTHRMFSRNSASSRAIPFKKMIESVKNNPFIPIAWQKDHSGMQGTEYFQVPFTEDCQLLWLESRDAAVKQAMELSEYGVTKQLSNRLLEPFLWHTAIVTATEWENFFALRAHPAAEIHIAKLAEVMLEAYNSSEPEQLKAGEWHIPFGDKIDEDSLYKTAYDLHNDHSTFKYDELYKVKIAVARCARVSYMNFDGSDDYEKDIQLHDRLTSMGHWSPFEHVAKAMSSQEFWRHIHGKDVGSMHEPDFAHDSFGWSGNFRGFIQYRKTFQDENKSDNRVIR